MYRHLHVLNPSTYLYPFTHTYITYIGMEVKILNAVRGEVIDTVDWGTVDKQALCIKPGCKVCMYTYLPIYLPTNLHTYIDIPGMRYIH